MPAPPEGPAQALSAARRVKPKARHWKLVRTALDKPGAKTELFHLNEDPTESRDLSESEPEQLARLLGLADELRVPSEVFPLRGVDDAP